MKKIKTAGFVIMTFVSLGTYSQDLKFPYNQFKVVDADTGKDLDTVEFKNYKSILIANGKRANLKDIKAKDFIMECDVYGQNMTFFGFREQDSLNAECVFFRLMASNTYESIQYLPITNGSTPWRLYSKYQASCQYKNKDWNHLKVEVIDSHVKVYVNKDNIPSLEVLKLKNKSESGSFYFSSSFGDSYIANVNIYNPRNDLKSVTNQKLTGKAYISKWMISNAFEEPFLAERLYRKMKDTISQWRPIEAEEDGIVNLSRYINHPTGTVFVKTHIYSNDTATKVLLFDYSYALGILLNNGIIFYGRELDSKNMGRVEEDEERLALHLKKGDNELVFAIKGDYETLKVLNVPHFQSMNWGFVARLNSYEGLEIKDKKE